MAKITFDNYSFKECIKKDDFLNSLRAKFADISAKDRHEYADREYNASISNKIFGNAMLAIGEENFLNPPEWPEAVLALAIDPLYAPAIMTVGCIEYINERIEEAMELFLSLPKLSPNDEPELDIIIDKAGDFLIDAYDFDNALILYTKADHIFPNNITHLIGLSFCLGKLKRHKEALEISKRVNELAPDDYFHLNDLGWGLYETGELEEAVKVLERAVELAPDDYNIAENNLKIVQKAMKRK